MPKSGYITSLEGLNYWFNLPHHQKLTTVVVTDTDVNGKLLYRSDADTHENAWIALKRFFEFFGSGGLFWVRFLVPKDLKGHEAVQIGFDYSPFGGGTPTPVHQGIAGMVSQSQSNLELEVAKLKWEKERSSNGLNGLIDKIGDSISKSPDSGVEAIKVLNTLMNGILVLGNNALTKFGGKTVPTQLSAPPATRAAEAPAEMNEQTRAVGLIDRLYKVVIQAEPTVNPNDTMAKIVSFAEKNPAQLKMLLDMQMEDLAQAA
ncbi:MAG: hypothetical protein RIS64_4577 [Bacteroidota bacterium]|jgi:hypothetical protein